MRFLKVSAFMSPWHLFACLLAILLTEPLSAVTNAITITNQSGASRSNVPYSISRVFVQGEIPQFAQARVNGTPITTQCDVKTRWADGSLQHAIISFLVDLPGSGAITVDFINSSQNSSGGMTKDQMLAVSWGAQIEATNGATTLTATARNILTDWNGSDSRVTYWLNGPVCTQVILEDRSTALTYDIGFDANKSMHPIFVVTFYPGSSAGVKVEMILENMWITKLQDQAYSLTLKVGNPATSTVYTKPSFTHYAKTRWRKTFWNGQAPPRARVDYNLAYLAQSKAIPTYDLTKVVPSSTLQGEYNSFISSDQGDINGVAFWTKFMPQTGGRDDIGLMPGWYARYLYSFDANAYDVMLGNGAVSGYVPIHARESNATLKYDSAGVVSAFGRPLSVDARPTIWGISVPPLQTLSNTHGWTLDVAHEPSFAYIPYLITGDWYFLEELYNWAAGAVASSDPANVAWGRNGSWGVISWAIQTRGTAWALRDLGQAAFMAPDGTPEKAYFREKLNNNIAVREGGANITDGAFYSPTAGSKWHWGRNTFSNGLAASPLGHPNYPDAYASKENMMSSGAFAVQYVDSPWMYGYLMIVYGHLQELGFPTQKIVNHFAKYFINGAVNPNFNPWLLGTYRTPVTRASTGQFFQTWSDLKSAFSTNYQTLTGWPPDEAAGGSGESSLSHGYPHILKAAMSFVAGLSDGPYSGQAAWNWVNASVGYQNVIGTNPRWSIVPRTGTTPVSTSKCDVNSDGNVNVLDVQVGINQALQPVTCSTGDVDRNGVCNVVDVQLVINTSLGGSCPL